MRFRIYISLFICAVIASLIACSPVQFGGGSNNQQASITGCNGASQNCTSNNGINSFNYTIPAPSTAADILFVVDNSASMFAIQTQIANRFSSFISSLGNLNYHIAITTTDIGGNTNPYSYAGVAVVQDGNLVTFGDGSNVITPSSANGQSLFAAGIERKETENCENWLAANNCGNNPGPCQSQINNYCPNQDTTAIWSSNLVVSNANSSFFRSSAPLSVIIVSNADEAACAGQANCPYSLQPLDEPGSLRNSVTSTFSSDKSLNVNSIIIRPGDSSCYQQQHFNNYVFGWYGYTYTAISQSTGNAPANICSTDYSSELANIGGTITNTPVTLPCTPIPGSFQITLNPADPTADPQLNGSEVTFAHALNPITQITLVFNCNAS